MILRKTGITWLQKGYVFKSYKNGIYNSVKYGLKGMRHKNANMYVDRK